MKFIRFVAAIHCIYMVVTAMWPIVDIQSFMLITGYKTDLWLVKTVSLLLLTNGLVIGSSLFLKDNYRIVALLGFLSAVVLFSVDVYYVSRQVIFDICLGDAVAESIIAALWIYGYWKFAAEASEKMKSTKR
jgi:hypothetical protein